MCDPRLPSCADELFRKPSSVLSKAFLRWGKNGGNLDPCADVLSLLQFVAECLY